jgi:hypothetical protein
VCVCVRACGGGGRRGTQRARGLIGVADVPFVFTAPPSAPLFVSVAADDVRFPFGVEPVPVRPALLSRPVVGIEAALSKEESRPQLGVSSAASRTRRILRELSLFAKNPHP